MQLRNHLMGTDPSPNPAAPPLIYKNMLKPGTVSLIDLSDSGMSELTNIVIADLLRGVQDAQDEAYQQYEKAKKENANATAPTRTVIVIEEAHEFLSEERIEKTKPTTGLHFVDPWPRSR
jgi:uncharacterized protein